MTPTEPGKSAAHRSHSSELRAFARYGAVFLAVLLAAVFIGAQTYRPPVTYGAPPDAESISDQEQSPQPTLPSTAELTGMLAANPIVRVGGAAATLDDATVTEALQGTDLRVLIVPGGLSKERLSALGDIPDCILVSGLRSESDGLVAVADSLDETHRLFAYGDVTDSVLALIAALAERPEAESPPVTTREPTDAELEAVTTALAADGVALLDGAETVSLPEKASAAFPAGLAPWVVVLPPLEVGAEFPDYASALHELHPDRPILQVTGGWVSYAGPDADDFAAAVASSMYGDYSDHLELGRFTQQQMLNAFLHRIYEFRFSGVFDRPLPDQAVDPISLTMPFLPWFFGALALVFVWLTVRDLRKRTNVATADRIANSARLARVAGLAELGIELAGLPGAADDPTLSHGLARIAAASDALSTGDADDADRQAEQARAALTDVAERQGFARLKPDEYLPGRWE